MQTSTIQKVREQFASMAIYKDPASTNSLFAGRNLPSFVKDFILKRYINIDGSVNRSELTGFLDMVIPQKQTEVKDRLASGEELTLLSRFIIYIDLVKGVRRFGIPDLGIKINEGQIPEYVYKNHQGELVDGEKWGIIKLSVLPDEDGKKNHVEMVERILALLKPIGSKEKDNWNYFCQFTNNIENINKQKNIKIFIPQDKKHILKSANLIFEFLADNNITHASLISSVTRVDDIVIKLTNFVNSNKYIKEGLLEPSPFSMTDGNISYAIDNKVSYNYELSYYISEYVNKLKTQCRLHNISCDDLKDFINVKYQNTFINGKNIKKFLNDRNITTSIVKNVINHMEVTELIITSLDREKNLSHFVSHFDKINNPEYIKKIYDYMYNLINNEILSFFISCSFSVIVIPLFIIILGMKKNERKYFMNKIFKGEKNE